MRNRPRILVIEPLHEAGLELLRQVGEVEIRPDLSPKEIQTIIGQYHALVAGSKTRIHDRIIEEGYNLRVIGSSSSRLDNIDVSTARALGIEVRSSPSSNAVAIAEHTLTHMLLLAAQMASRQPEMSRGLSGKTLGIIGFGPSGREVARRALSFDMRVVVNQPRLTPELALDAGVTALDLVDLLREADFVSLHVPFKAETETLIGAAELALMKPTACLVNTGHTDLVDDAALLAAVDTGRIAGAALPEYPQELGGPRSEQAAQVRQHPHVLVAPHLTKIIGDRRRAAAIAVAEQVIESLRAKRPSESLSLEVVPIDQVAPHEEIDDKRVGRLMQSLERDGRLVNPPVTTYWKGKYIILDGATRFTALKRLGFPHVIVQVVDAVEDEYTLHTWYHAIASTQPAGELFAFLRQFDQQFILADLPADQIQHVFQDDEALGYFLDVSGRATVARAAPGKNRLEAMNTLVDAYTRWGTVERTLLTDLSRLKAQIPDLVAVAVFPQFQPETVFDVASRGDYLPAGLTRFLIPGRILRLNADLGQLKKDEPLVAKRAWFNQFLADKLARSRLRYYQEPVILLDE